MLTNSDVKNVFLVIYLSQYRQNEGSATLWPLNIFVIGSYSLIKDQFRALKIKIKLKRITKIEKQNFKKELLILDVPLKFKKPFSINKRKKAKYVINSLNLSEHTSTLKLSNTYSLGLYVFNLFINLS